MRKNHSKYEGVEALEDRYLLSVNDCIPCLPDPNTSEPNSAEFASNEVPSFANIDGDTVEIVDGQGQELSALAVPERTLFGVPEVLELEPGSQRIAGDLSERPVYPFYFELTEETNIQIRNVVGNDARVGIYTLQNEIVTQVTDGSADVTLEAGEYLLYIHDFHERVSEFEIEITLPESRHFVEEFDSVPYIGSSFDWNLNSINAPEVWAHGFTGEGTVVAVLDTGVDYTHPDLDDNIFINTGEIAGDGIDNDGNGYVDDVHGFDFAYFDNDPSDIDGHGTHVAGTIAAERNGFGTTGVAYDATILPVKVLRDDGSGSSNSIAAGIRYAVDTGADVINLSLGGGVTRSVVNALRYAWSNDVLVVAASGNDAANRPGAPAIYSSLLSNTISVGAHTQSNNLSSFSNRVGDTSAVQIDAPGSRIASTTPGGGYRYLSGTSMATPHVAGVAALAYSANNDLRASDARSFLVGGSNQIINGSDSVGGVNASRTVALAYQFDAYADFELLSTELEQNAFDMMSVGSAFATDTVDVELAAALNTNLDGSVSAKKNLFHVTEREENRPLELRTHARAAIAEAIFARTESQLFAPSIEFDDAQIETSELSTESDDDRENLI